MFVNLGKIWEILFGEDLEFIYICSIKYPNKNVSIRYPPSQEVFKDIEMSLKNSDFSLKKFQFLRDISYFLGDS